VREVLSWRAWVQPDGSFYIAPRELAGAVKVSLHLPNQNNPRDGWFFGFTKEFVSEYSVEPPGHARIEPYVVEPKAPGITRVCTVRIPFVVVNDERVLPKQAQHLWVASPQEGMAAEVVLCLITDPQFSWVVEDGTSVGDLSNHLGTRLVAFSRQVGIPERMRMAVDAAPGATDADPAQLRGVAMGRLAEDGSVVLEEIVAERR
jgi:hypothetical protein